MSEIGAFWNICLFMHYDYIYTRKMQEYRVFESVTELWNLNLLTCVLQIVLPILAHFTSKASTVIGVSLSKSAIQNYLWIPC